MKTPPSLCLAPRPTGIDLDAVRAKLNGVRGQEYWRSLDEVAETAEFQEMLHREFPDGASEWPRELNRRDFLRLAAASLALAGVTACTKQPPQQILPYVNQPANLVLGEPLVYAIKYPSAALLLVLLAGLLATFPGWQRRAARL